MKNLGDNQKIRLVTKNQLKKAYERKNVESKIDIKEELVLESIEKVPKELFEILGETLSFIEKVNKMEGERDENK
ncbi:hypothetical protein [Tepidimicrobium xylanilyticum]|uniref:Uncharacterized protein n=1 Tax=Tepidimicrobium xylanilyticum TaxID=1123352 RepID=A0A1H3C917_9FIRM|nr:hypothetical protein [Tepidimicrobium xylanilyticum]GMG97988.1 hypothetical protein EN5CB1_28140 [Tepidimicrobium xylanilyticum]SDX50540.1 hypothetical protein SAMN05660923_02420 [Tepidimicrobium xylanilyticum]